MCVCTCILHANVCEGKDEKQQTHGKYKRETSSALWALLTEYIISFKSVIYFTPECSWWHTYRVPHCDMLLIVAWQGVCMCEYISLCVCLCTVCAHVCVHMGLCEGEIMRSCSAEAWSWSPEALDSFQWETSEQSEHETEHLWQKRKTWSQVEGSKRTMSLLCALSLYESRMKAFVLQCRENFFWQYCSSRNKIISSFLD